MLTPLILAEKRFCCQNPSDIVKIDEFIIRFWYEIYGVGGKEVENIFISHIVGGLLSCSLALPLHNNPIYSGKRDQ